MHCRVSKQDADTADGPVAPARLLRAGRDHLLARPFARPAVQAMPRVAAARIRALLAAHRAARLRAHRRGKHPRAEQHVGARRDGHVPGRLLWHPDVEARDGVSFQRHGRANVLGQQSQLPRHGAAVRECGGRGVECTRRRLL